MWLWCDGAHGARENMRRDALLLERCAAGALAQPVLRLFRFAPAGITLGHSQRAEDELDLDLLAAAGVEYAVRPTGGRAIWHDEEWTFSFTTALGEGARAADPSAAYERTCRLVAGALVALGAPVELAAGSPSGVGRPRGEGVAAPPCFASTARHELLLAGRKFAGVAQRRVRDALLQQGSLLLGDSHLRLADVIRGTAERRAATRRALAASAAHAGAWLPPDAPLERLAGAVTGVAEVAERFDGAAGEWLLG
ncbi:MAG: hypothetical protein U0704_12225 [Candidatus Eisenbacteria bacterium]